MTRWATGNRQQVTAPQGITTTATAGSNGLISPGSTLLSSGGSVTYTIVSNFGYHVADVLVNGSSVGAVSSYTFRNMTASHTISASFAANTYTVTTSAGGGGTISPSTPQTVNYNSTTLFTVTPNTGYSISSVTGCGGSLSGNTYMTGPITADCTVSVTSTPNGVSMVAGSTQTYSSLGAAYNAAVSGNAIEVQAVTLTESPVFNRLISVTIQGGYDNSFTIDNGNTVASGQMTISNGMVIVNNLIGN